MAVGSQLLIVMNFQAVVMILVGIHRILLEKWRRVDEMDLEEEGQLGQHPSDIAVTQLEVGLVCFGLTLETVHFVCDLAHLNW